VKSARLNRINKSVVGSGGNYPEMPRKRSLPAYMGIPIRVVMSQLLTLQQWEGLEGMRQTRKGARP
jgi:hypothetical protein